MEEGSLRCDANVSLRPAGTDELGTKTELKNMNSFRFMERGIEAEIERQAAILDAGGRVEQETLHFDPRTGTLTPLRSKEYSHDYRYFPEPDLVPLEPTEEMIADRPRGAARAARRAPRALPERARARRRRPRRELAFDADARRVLRARSQAADRRSRRRRSSPTGSPASCRGGCARPARTAPIRPLAGGPEALATLARAWSTRSRSRTRRGRQVLRDAWSREGGDPAEIAEREGLAADARTRASSRRSSSARSRPTPRPPSGSATATRRRSGRWSGFVMRETKGRADGGEVTRLIHQKLGAVSPCACNKLLQGAVH